MGFKVRSTYRAVERGGLPGRVLITASAPSPGSRLSKLSFVSTAVVVPSPPSPFQISQELSYAPHLLSEVALLMDEILGQLRWHSIGF